MNLPNRISLARIILVPFMLTIFLLWDYIPYAKLIATGVFIIASCTDFIDGYIARKYNLVTTLGKFLDSIADKVLCATAFVLLVFDAPMYRELVTACVAITIAREFLISALRQIAASKNIIVAADKLGKIKAIFQSVAIPVMMAAPDLSTLIKLDTKYLYGTGFVLLIISTLTALAAAVHYLIVNRRVFVSQEESVTNTKEDLKEDENKA